VKRPEFALALIVPLLVAGAARAEDAPEARLKAVEQAIDESRARHDAAAAEAASLAAEIGDLQVQSVAAAQAAQAHQAALAAIALRLQALAADEHAKRAALAQDGHSETALLMALARVAAMPGEALALAPRPPLDTVRGALLMARTVPPLEARAAHLRGEIAALEDTSRAIAAAEARQGEERQALAGDAARIAALVARKTALRDTAARTAADSQLRLVALAAESSSLRDLIDRLDAERRKAEAERAQPPPVAQAPVALVYPVAGTLVARFGAPDENGVPGRGLTFATRPGATIVAPVAGEVAFAGPFRGYGQILIIAHGDGYHSLLAGLDRVDASPGQKLLAGEPVGTMAEADQPRLYLELRRDNQPIDPAPWLPTPTPAPEPAGKEGAHPAALGG
jgi:septal ring factor EnvC (AmiA/AmiB activator)